MSLPNHLPTGTQDLDVNNYSSYRVEDFIQDDDFRDWVQGRSYQEAFWLSFPEQYPEKQEAMQRAERFIRATQVSPERISDLEIRKEANLFIERASAYIPNRQNSLPDFHHKKSIWNTSLTFRWSASVAALLAVIIGMNWYLSRSKPAELTPQRARASTVHLVETTNDTQHPLRVILNDSSEVLLSPQSQLRYPAQFTGNSRIVYLKGEANFSVKRRNQPFMVYTGNMVTKVLGTRFVVRAFDLDKEITVQVASGKVSVYKEKQRQSPDNKEVNGLILHANQAAIFEKSDGNLTKTLVANPTLVTKNVKEAQFVYDEVALSVILRELEKSYGIPIQFDEQSFETCKITATLSTESLYEKLDLLCKAAPASYEITDGQIVISRKSSQ
ncbi:FecR family protein [Spirosoma endophyticum]|uniref:FecR family protein n=1 Tax=Spirosoma endophyticum TaxID=662367 RepID=A0A1I1WED9_9BACT|nr:FecR family protein [Spirosoma endophyticum]